MIRKFSAEGDRLSAYEHSAQGQSQMEELLLALPLSQPQRHRTHVLPIEGLQARRHALRPKRSELPRSSLPPRDRQLLVMSPSPRSAIFKRRSIRRGSKAKAVWAARLASR